MKLCEIKIKFNFQEWDFLEKYLRDCEQSHYEPFKSLSEYSHETLLNSYTKKLFNFSQDLLEEYQGIQNIVDSCKFQYSGWNLVFQFDETLPLSNDLKLVIEVNAFSKFLSSGTHTAYDEICVLENCIRLHKDIIRRCHEDYFHSEKEALKVKKMRSAPRPNSCNPFKEIKLEIEKKNGGKMTPSKSFSRLVNYVKKSKEGKEQESSIYNIPTQVPLSQVSFEREASLPSKYTLSILNGNKNWSCDLKHWRKLTQKREISH